MGNACHKRPYGDRAVESIRVDHDNDPRIVLGNPGIITDVIKGDMMVTADHHKGPENQQDEQVIFLVIAKSVNSGFNSSGCRVAVYNLPQGFVAV